LDFSINAVSDIAESASTLAASAIVTIAEEGFQPAVLTIPVGTEVTWRVKSNENVTEG
jgi:plastocyanin